MIKICHLISSCLTHHGPSNVLIPIVRQSDPKLYQFSVWSLYPPPENRNPQQILREVGARFQVFKMASFIDARILVSLVRGLRLLRPNILHCHLVRANLYGRIAAKLAGVPVVISTYHGIEDYMVSNSLRDRAVRIVELMTAGWVSCHVGVSEGMRLAAIQHLRIAPDKIVTIPNGVDIAMYECNRASRIAVRRELGLDPEAIVVGSVGILNETKNFKQLLHVAKSVVNRYPDVKFIIFGDGDQRRELEVMITDLGLSSSVILYGFSTDIPRALMALDIFALTSRSEGFSLAVAEAMASGLPCVVFDVGALHELVVDNQTGFLVAADDSDDFGVALNRLITKPGLRSSMGHLARKRVKERFSVELMARRYNELYNHLIAD